MQSIKWIVKNDFHQATVDEYHLEITKAFDMGFSAKKGLLTSPEYYSATVRKLKPIPERYKSIKVFGRYNFVESFKCQSAEEAKTKLANFLKENL